MCDDSESSDCNYGILTKKLVSNLDPKRFLGSVRKLREEVFREFPTARSDLESLRMHNSGTSKLSYIPLTTRKAEEIGKRLNNQIKEGTIEIRVTEEYTTNPGPRKPRVSYETYLDWSFACLVCRMTEFYCLAEFAAHCDGRRHAINYRDKRPTDSGLDLFRDRHKYDRDGYADREPQSKRRRFDAHQSENRIRDQNAYRRDDDGRDSCRRDDDRRESHRRDDDRKKSYRRDDDRRESYWRDDDRRESYRRDDDGRGYRHDRGRHHHQRYLNDEHTPTRTDLQPNSTTLPGTSNAPVANISRNSGTWGPSEDWPRFEDLPEDIWESQDRFSARAPRSRKQLKKQEKRDQVYAVAINLDISIQEAVKTFTAAKERRLVCDVRKTYLRNVSLREKDKEKNPNFTKVLIATGSSSSDEFRYDYKPFEDQTYFNAVVSRRIHIRKKAGVPLLTPIIADRKTNYDRKDEEPILNVLAFELLLGTPEEGKTAFSLQKKLVKKIRLGYRSRFTDAAKEIRNHRSRRLPPDVKEIKVKSFGSVKTKVESHDSDVDVFISLIPFEGKTIEKVVIKDFQERVTMLMSHQLEKDRYASADTKEVTTKPEDEYMLLAESEFPSTTDTSRTVIRSSFVHLETLIQVDISFHGETRTEEVDKKTNFRDLVSDEIAKFPVLMNSIEVVRILFTKMGIYGGSEGGITNLCILHAALRARKAFKNDIDLFRSTEDPTEESPSLMDSKNWIVTRFSYAILWFFFLSFKRTLSGEDSSVVKDPFGLEELPPAKLMPEHVQIQATIESVEEPGVNLFACHKTKLKAIFYELTRALYFIDCQTRLQGKRCYDPSREVLNFNALIKEPHERHKEYKGKFNYREVKARGMFYPNFNWKRSWEAFGKRLFTEEFSAKVHKNEAIGTGPFVFTKNVAPES